MSSALWTLPDDFWALASDHLGANDLTRLILAGNGHLTRRIRRSARSIVLQDLKGGFFDVNRIFQAVSTLSKLESLEASSKFDLQCVQWPVNFGKVPKGLRQLRLSFRRCIQVALGNPALSILLPSLELLSLTMKGSNNDDCVEIDVSNVPRSVTHLEIQAGEYATTQVANLRFLPDKLITLKMQCRWRGISSLSLASLLQRLPLQHLDLSGNVISSHLHGQLQVSELPATLKCLRLDFPRLELDYLARNTSEYHITQEKTGDATLDNDSRLEAIKAARISKKKIALKDAFPALRSLTIRNWTCDFDSMQLLPPEMTHLDARIRGPEPTEDDLIRYDEDQRNGHSIQASPPPWMFDCDVIRNLTFFRSASSFHYSVPVLSLFSSLRELCIPELVLTSDNQYRLPETLGKLRIGPVKDVDALPEGLNHLDCISLETPSESPLNYRGMPSGLQTLLVTQMLGSNQIEWLPASLSSLTAPLANRAAWLAFTPSHSHWHMIYNNAPRTLPRSHPCDSLPTSRLNVSFLPNLVFLRDYSDHAGLRTCLDIPPHLKTLHVGINPSPSPDSSRFFNGFEGICGNLSFLRLKCNLEKLSSIFPHLPRNLKQLECRSATWSYTIEDLKALPPNLESLVLFDRSAMFADKSASESDQLFNPDMARALPRTLQALYWEVKLTSLVKKSDIDRFVAQLPPTISHLRLHPKIESRYYLKKEVYGGEKITDKTLWDEDDDSSPSLGTYAQWAFYLFIILIAGLLPNLAAEDFAFAISGNSDTRAVKM